VSDLKKSFTHFLFYLWKNKEVIKMEKYEVLKNLVEFNTIKDKENPEIIDYLENYLTSLGFKTEYKSKCLVMSIGENPQIGFLGHTDTVEYIEEFKNPHTLTLKDGNLYGLGACDMKGGIAAMLDAVSEIDFSNTKGGMKFYFTYDEEIGFGGIYELIKKDEQFPKLMVFGEPTNNEMLVGSKGLLEYKINFKGLKAHSSNPEKGISANLNAVKFLYELNSFYESEIKNDKQSYYEIPYTTMNVGLMNGGSAINSVPASCNITIDFRISNKDHIDKIVKKVDELAKVYNAEVKVNELIEPFIDNIDFVKEVKTAGFMTEASVIPVSQNVKKIILGTGPVTAHEVNEHISVESYDKLINQYKDLIKWCN
jgi:acetylornithine deacetylase